MKTLLLASRCVIQLEQHEQSQQENNKLGGGTKHSLYICRQRTPISVFRFKLRF